MNTKILSTTFVAEALEESVLRDILTSIPEDDHDSVLTYIAAIIGLSTLTHIYESIEDTHKRAAFLHRIPHFLNQELMLADLAEYRDDLPQLAKEHITRTLLALRTKLKALKT